MIKVLIINTHVLVCILETRFKQKYIRSTVIRFAMHIHVYNFQASHQNAATPQSEWGGF